MPEPDTVREMIWNAFMPAVWRPDLTPLPWRTWIIRARGQLSFHIYNKQSDNTIKEQSTFMVAIINNVQSRPRLKQAWLQRYRHGWFFLDQRRRHHRFVNDRGLTFGVLAPGAAKTLGQKLKVSTNATYGFTVTVFQDHNLISSGGADIDSFKDGVEATTTPLAWAAPADWSARKWLTAILAWPLTTAL